MHYIPGLRLRLSSPEAEIIGIDDAEMGEFAYDYVGIDSEIGTQGRDKEIEDARGRVGQPAENVRPSGAQAKEEGSSSAEEGGAEKVEA